MSQPQNIKNQNEKDNLKKDQIQDDHQSRQATINIGTIGHVAHGKSTLVQRITTTTTIKYKSELERNITIKLGYANAKIFCCSSEKCPRPGRYKSYHSSSPDCLPCPRPGCEGQLKLVRHVSFIDCPGHDVLMSTMLNGTAIMDFALLLVAANEPVPQPQTQEHVFALKIVDLKKVIIVQNKIDLISKEAALKQKLDINTFVKKNIGLCPVIPVSSQLGVNVDAVLDYIVNYVQVPARDLSKEARMVIIRSFDVNKPGTGFEDLKGGVIGGSLIAGRINIGDEIEIRPGVVSYKGKNVVCKPILTKIVSLKTEENELDYAVPGGLIGIGTLIDPGLCKRDRLVGQVLGLRSKLPDIYIIVVVEYSLFRKIILSGSKRECDVVEIKEGENLQLNVGSTTTIGLCKRESEKVVKVKLQKPVCCGVKDRIALSRKVSGHFRLIGSGVILGGEMVEPVYE